jgi:hypothetical protein
MSLERKDFEKELAPFDGVVAVGDKSDKTKKIQEWLCLHRFHTQGWNVSVARDGDYGPATKAAVQAFQAAMGLPSTGEVDEQTWHKLTLPMRRAFEYINFSPNETLSERVAGYLRQFLREHPTELHPNLGPWVRSFMKGHDGEWAHWCNGSISTAIDHACNTMGIDMDTIIPWTWSCPEARKFAMSKKYKCTYIKPEDVKKDPSVIGVGDLGLVMKGTAAQHIFGVVGMTNSVMHTIEGNTNDEGSAYGYEMCGRMRDAASGRYAIIKLNT